MVKLYHKITRRRGRKPVPVHRWAPLMACVFAAGITMFSLAASPGPTKVELDEMKALYQRPKATPYPKTNEYSVAKIELGRRLFFDARLSGPGNMSCATCHNPVRQAWLCHVQHQGALLRLPFHLAVHGDSFHDIGVWDNDIGRGSQVKGVEMLQHAFKTPGLRNVTQRAPYMHNGSIKTLEDVVRHYNDGFMTRPGKSADIHRLFLTGQDIDDLVAFPRTLTSPDTKFAATEIPVGNTK